MRLNVGSRFSSAFAVMFAVLGCGGDSGPHTGKHDIWFMGAVVNGVTSAPLTDYTITLVWGNNTTKGKVDGTTGRFVVGPLQAWNDYGILIDGHDGYRAFSSYNAGIAPPPPAATALSSDIYSSDTTQTLNFDASLFPTGITTPDLTIGIAETGPDPKAAAGNIRLQPTAQPTIQSSPSEVPGQVWSNDNDLYAAAISGTFSGGTFVATGDKLVYGVSYAITTYGVEGYQPSGPTNVQAGVNTQATILINPLTVSPLQLVSNTVSACRAPAALTDTMSALVTLTFNQAVEDGTQTPGGAAEVLDNGLLITTSLATSILATNASATVQERGTSLVIAGNVVTLSWNASTGLLTKWTGDVVRNVYYQNLTSLMLQPKGHPELRTSLGQLLSSALLSTTITCVGM